MIADFMDHGLLLVFLLLLPSVSLVATPFLDVLARWGRPRTARDWRHPMTALDRASDRIALALDLEARSSLASSAWTILCDEEGAAALRSRLGDELGSRSLDFEQTKSSDEQGDRILFQRGRADYAVSFRRRPGCTTLTLTSCLRVLPGREPLAVVAYYAIVGLVVGSAALNSALVPHVEHYGVLVWVAAVAVTMVATWVAFVAVYRLLGTFWLRLRCAELIDPRELDAHLGAFSLFAGLIDHSVRGGPGTVLDHQAWRPEQSPSSPWPATRIAVRR